MPAECSFVAEYAKSGRATCKGCKRPICKGVLRIGIKTSYGKDEGEHVHLADAPKWYHSQCKCVGQFRKSASWWEENLAAHNDFVGFSDLKEEDQEDLETLVEALRSGKGVPPKQGGVSKSPRSKAKSKKREESNDEDDSEDEESSGEETPKKTKRDRKYSKSKKNESASEGEESEGSEPDEDHHHDNDGKEKKKPSNENSEESGSEDEADEESEDEKPKTSPRKVKAQASNGKRNKRDYDFEESDEQDSDVSKQKGKKTKPAPKKSVAGRKKQKTTDYTADALDEKTVEKIVEVIQQLSKKTMPQLKAMASKNNMKVSGIKQELLERIGEGTVLGVMPKCASCGGNLEFDRNEGTYKCKGIFEEGRLKRCAFEANHVDRTPWRE